MRRRLLPVCVGLCCFVVYLANLRPMAAWDSAPARLLPYSLLMSGNLDLDEFGWLRDTGTPYFLRQSRQGHWISQYPIATALLATPVAAPAVWWLLRNRIAMDDVRFRLVTLITERVAAALLAAASVSLVCATALRMTTPAVATGLALAYGLGTPTWSISSQALWQHAGAQLSLAALTMALTRPASRRSTIGAGVWATLGVLVRPTMCIFAAAAALCVCRERPRQIRIFLAAPVVGAALLLAYNLFVVGQVTGGQGSLWGWPQPEALLGLLVSPNRGLFVFVPAAWLALPGIVRPRVSDGGGWLRYLGAGVVAHWVLFSCWQMWWGGYSFGPRFFCDVLPALAILSLPAVARALGSWRGRVMLAALAGWGVAVQVTGVYFDDGAWNREPVSVDKFPRRVWDFGDLQIMRAGWSVWRGMDFAPLLAQLWSDPRPAILQPLRREDLVGRLASMGPGPYRYAAGGVGTITLRVSNDGQTMWPALSDIGAGNCVIGYRWWRNGEMVLTVSGFVALPRNLGPGEAADVVVRFNTPPAPGAYELEFALVQVRDAQSGLFGGMMLQVPVQID